MATCEHSSGVAKAGLTTGIIGTSLTRVDDMAQKYAPILKEFGLMNESNLLDTEKVKLFIDTAFQKQSEVKINLMGIPFKFDSSDGQALLEIMERYKE